MNPWLIVLIVLTADVLLGVIVSHFKKKVIKKRNEKAVTQIFKIMKNKKLTNENKIAGAKEVCRQNRGKSYAIIYHTLEIVEEYIIKDEAQRESEMIDDYLGLN